MVYWAVKKPGPYIFPKAENKIIGFFNKIKIFPNFRKMKEYLNKDKTSKTIQYKLLK